MLSALFLAPLLTVEDSIKREMMSSVTNGYVGPLFPEFGLLSNSDKIFNGGESGSAVDALSKDDAFRQCDSHSQ